MQMPDLIGYAGVALILSAYALLQTGKLQSSALAYSVLNGLGAVGVLISLWFDPNLPSIVIESAWLMISLFGIYRAVFAR